jgi:hypothetical protein
MSNVLATPHTQAPSETSALTDFYREEFIKHQRCLQQNREYYSAKVIIEAESALVTILTRLEQLCCKDDAGEVVSRLLHQIDLVTRLSARSDSRQAH